MPACHSEVASRDDFPVHRYDGTKLVARPCVATLNHVIARVFPFTDTLRTLRGAVARTQGGQLRRAALSARICSIGTAGGLRDSGPLGRTPARRPDSLAGFFTTCDGLPGGTWNAPSCLGQSQCNSQTPNAKRNSRIS